MKKLLLLSIFALGLNMASCTQDGLGTDSETVMPVADDTGGMTGNTNTTPPPPPPPPPRP